MRRKTAIVMAGALAFDLGILVVAGHAAETPKGATATPAPAPGTLTVRKAGEKPVEYLKYKLSDVLVSSYAIDSTNTRQGCEQKLGKVVDVGGMPVCKLPANPAPTAR